MDLILVIFALLILTGSKAKVEGDYLSKDSTLALRGILAVAIILHHLSEKTGTGFLFPFMVHTGYLIVAIFFFLSGYGLSVQYQKKGNAYLQSFFRNRIVYIFLIWLFFGIIYYIYHISTGIDISIKDALISFVYGKPIVKYSWYIAVQLWMYVFFFSVYRFPKLNDWYRIGVVTSFLSILAVVYSILRYESTWYISNGSFVVGLAFPILKNRYDVYSKNHWVPCLILWAIFFSLFSMLPIVVEHYYVESSFIRIFSRVVSTMVFVMMIITLLQKVQLKSRLWSMIGECSLEIYLIHGLIMMLFRGNPLYVSSDCLWTTVVVITSILMALPLHKITTLIGECLRK